MRQHYSLGSATLLVMLSMVFVQCEMLESQLNDPAADTSARKPAPGDGGGTTDPTSGTWTQVFADEFSSLPSGDTWDIWKSGAFNNELQYYQGVSNITIEKDGTTDNSFMTITARKETATGATHPWDTTPKTFGFTSGRIETKKLFTPTSSASKVRMQARIQLPAGYGMWPAFWSYGDNWPVNGEIDILEAKGHEPFQYATNYFYGRRANTNLVRNGEKTIHTPNTNLTEGFHTYELIWTKDALYFYLDNKLVDTKTGGYVPDLFGKLQRVTLNLAVGGDYFGTYNPADIVTGTMKVDWVKVSTAP